MGTNCCDIRAPQSICSRRRIMIDELEWHTRGFPVHCARWTLRKTGSGSEIMQWKSRAGKWFIRYFQKKWVKVVDERSEVQEYFTKASFTGTDPSQITGCTCATHTHPYLHNQFRYSMVSKQVTSICIHSPLQNSVTIQRMLGSLEGFLGKK